MEDLGWWGVALAVLAGAIRVSTPFLFVSLGELLTEKSGRINLGLEGTLVMGAMSGYAISYLSGSPWLGVLVAGVAGALFGMLHAAICSLPKVNDIAVGIALMLLGTGLAGMVEVAAVHGSANASLVAGYGYTGILIAFIARQNPLAIIPVALMFGGIAASGGLLQRRLDLPDATILVLQGIAFVMILASDTLYGRFRIFQPRG